MIGALAYKPQFGVLIPLALLASGRWNTIAAAIATVAALVAVSFVTLGGEVWHAFAGSMNFTQTVVLEQAVPAGRKSSRYFRRCGCGARACSWPSAVQIALALMLAATLAWLWHGDAAFELKAAGLATASLLATPYVLDYDLVVLAIAIAFFARHGLAHGFRTFEISLLAAAWIVPLLSRGIAGATGVPLGLVVLLTLYGFTLRRAVLDRSSGAVSARRVAEA